MHRLYKPAETNPRTILLLIQCENSTLKGRPNAQKHFRATKGDRNGKKPLAGLDGKSVPQREQGAGGLASLPDNKQIRARFLVGDGEPLVLEPKLRYSSPRLCKCCSQPRASRSLARSII